MTTPTTPLFIPLRRPYFEAFRRGEKTTEYRPYGPRWNERTCVVGRSVTLSLGYGKAHRLTGVIVGFRRVPLGECAEWRMLKAIYGEKLLGKDVAEIEIEVERQDDGGCFSEMCVESSDVRKRDC